MSDNNAEPPRRGMEALKAHISNNLTDAALWVLRVLTIIFTLGYLLPIFG